MVTGASTADVALVLIDARQGLVEQSRRHAFIASLLHVPHLVACVNKMDLVDWDQDVFDAIMADLARLRPPARAARAARRSRSPRCNGDNVVERSDAAPWYDGPPLLEYLEAIDVAADRQVFDEARLPVQWVVRPHDDAHHDYRGHAGQLVAGDAARRRRGRGPARRRAHEDRPARHVRRPGRGGVRADVGHRAARGRPRRRARRRAVRRRRPGAGGARPARRRLLARRAARAAVRPLPRQAHDADHAGRADAGSSTGSTSAACAPSPTRAASSSTTSAASRCARPRRWSSTATPTIAPPAASS